MQFRLVVVGRIRDANLRAVAEEFERRLAHYINFSVHECADASARDAAHARQREETGILKALPRGGEVVLLTREGRSCSSRVFAEQVTRWHESGQDTTFVIGGAFGVSPAVQQRATRTMSLSSMTWPHELARVMFLEQLYRANTIRRGEPYHKGD